MIKQNLVEMYSSGENVSVSYLKRINEDEAAGIIAMCAVNTRLIDVSQVCLSNHEALVILNITKLTL